MDRRREETRLRKGCVAGERGRAHGATSPPWLDVFLLGFPPYGDDIQLRIVNTAWNVNVHILGQCTGALFSGTEVTVDIEARVVRGLAVRSSGLVWRRCRCECRCGRRCCDNGADMRVRNVAVICRNVNMRDSRRGQRVPVVQTQLGRRR